MWINVARLWGGSWGEEELREGRWREAVERMEKVAARNEAVNPKKKKTTGAGAGQASGASI